VTVSWTREQRHIARQQDLPLVTLAVDRTETYGGGGGGRTEFSRPVSEPVAAAVEELMRKILLDLQAEGKQGVPG
jgi:hypothetical protein